MTLHSQYYREILYPLQDGVLNAISHNGTDFFLTGGTALSRGYYHHRFSDDLDFFLDRSESFDEQLDIVLAGLRANGFSWSTQTGFIRADNYASLVVRRESEAILKLDFVNDLVPHFGGIHATELFYRVDSVRNILSNKLTALSRYAAKDVADIREIALQQIIDWPAILSEAKQKEAGIEPPHIAEILTSFPMSEFDAIAWTVKPDWSTFKEDINRIVHMMLTASVTS